MNFTNDYTALILAAGIGSRISDLTNHPKCLLKINGRTILEWQLDSLIFCGITKVVIVIGYEENLIKNIAERYQGKLKIQYVFNEHYRTKGNTYSLSRGLNQIHNCALIFDADLIFEKEILSNFIQSIEENQILVGKCSALDIECSKVLINSDEKISIIADKREITDDEFDHFILAGEALGILKFSKDYIENLKRVCADFLAIEKNQKSNWEALINIFIQNHSLYTANSINSRWMEIDTIEDYRNALRIFE